MHHLMQPAAFLLLLSIPLPPPRQGYLLIHTRKGMGMGKWNAGKIAQATQLASSSHTTCIPLARPLACLLPKQD
ncbi:hypothetical protein N431DRAFT_434630 [Stipitochalara longipes BDJ]|nr:hypothetical protein N431DRAFT_434630 [Stipitochalara longipes BDJ]